MLKKAFLLAGAVLALAVAGSASIPIPPCNPCVVDMSIPIPPCNPCLADIESAR